MKIPPYTHFPTISIENIVLRQVLPSDIPGLVEISYYDAKQARSIAEATEMQARIDRDYLAGNSIHWAIEDKRNNAVVGTCGYYRGFDNETGELGCILLTAFQGQGYMARALQGAITYGLAQIGLKRIIAITTQQNNRAINLLNRLGFKQVSVLNQDDVIFEYSNTL